MLFKRGKCVVCRQSDVNKKFEELWLLYFNDSLFAKGIITEDERNAMSLKITAGKSH